MQECEKKIPSTLNQVGMMCHFDIGTLSEPGNDGILLKKIHEIHIFLVVINLVRDV